MSDDGCCYCKTTTKELRPYGPGGARVCFACAFATPEREEQTKNEFAGMLGDAGPMAILTSDGPMPYAKKGEA